MDDLLNWHGYVQKLFYFRKLNFNKPHNENGINDDKNTTEKN